jgi:hypothetical protein
MTMSGTAMLVSTIQKVVMASGTIGTLADWLEPRELEAYKQLAEADLAGKLEGVERALMGAGEKAQYERNMEYMVELCGVLQQIKALRAKYQN